MSAAITKHFFVDEAGDLTLMGRRGKSLIGTEGVSRCFMVGVAHIVDPAGVGRELEELRQVLLSDAYLKGVPSMQPEAGLQVIDYFLWALQRLYERGEDRYFNFLAPRYRLIMDFDDMRSGKSYGTWYSDQNPLAKEKMMPATS